MDELRGRFAEIGISGYPESHHFISDEATIEAMFEKEPMATYIVSQICFDTDVIAIWVRRVRDRGTKLPIWIGIPGVTDNRRLLRISLKIGLGESARFLEPTAAGWRACCARAPTRPPSCCCDWRRRSPTRPPGSAAFTSTRSTSSSARRTGAASSSRS